MPKIAEVLQSDQTYRTYDFPQSFSILVLLLTMSGDVETNPRSVSELLVWPSVSSGSGGDHPRAYTASCIWRVVPRAHNKPRPQGGTVHLSFYKVRINLHQYNIILLRFCAVIKHTEPMASITPLAFNYTVADPEWGH